MGWNHRVIRHKATEEQIAIGDSGEDGYFYSIHEVYYKEDNDKYPVCYTKDAIGIVGSSLDEIKWTIERMTECLNKPVLDPETDFVSDFKNESDEEDEEDEEDLDGIEY